MQRTIVIMGNSVSLVMRPPRAGADERTYAEILAGELPAQVINWSQRAATVGDGLRAVEREVVPRYPEAVILQYGIVECTYRDVPRWLYQYTKLRLQGDEGALERLPVRLAARLLVPLSRAWARARGTWRWMEPPVFAEDLRKLTALIRKETAASIFLLSIPQPSARVEGLSPGTQRSAGEYNAALRDLAASEKITLLDAAAIAAPDPERLLPDGIHFSAAGHRLVADQLIALLNEGRDGA